MKTTLTMLALLLASLSTTGCVVYDDGSYPQHPPPPPPPYQGSWHTVDMFASGALASSDGVPGNSDYSAAQALGAPDVNACTDDPRAWSPSSADPYPGVSPAGDPVDDWLELTYDEPVSVHQVRLYERTRPAPSSLSTSSPPSAPSLRSISGRTITATAPPRAPASSPSRWTATRSRTPTTAWWSTSDSNLVGDANGNGNWNDDYDAIDAVEVIGDIYY